LIVQKNDKFFKTPRNGTRKYLLRVKAANKLKSEMDPQGKMTDNAPHFLSKETKTLNKNRKEKI
jgi:hypothetical protein